MSADAVALAETLRAGRDVSVATLADQQLFERWLARDAWSLADEAVPLLIGVDPALWPHHVATNGIAAEAAALGELLSADPAVAGGAIAPAALREFARRRGIELPGALTTLLDFIAKVVPAPGTRDAAADDVASGEREKVLGAALALVTKFPGRCRDANGFYDGALIADLMLEKAVVWFPDRPPEMRREDIARLLERYLA